MGQKTGLEKTMGKMFDGTPFAGGVHIAVPEDRSRMSAEECREREDGARGDRMRILFLDFDGVLNTGRYQSCLCAEGKSGWDDYGQLFAPAAVANLKLILDSVPDVRIVIISSWKVNGLEEMRLMWLERKLPGSIYDVSPTIFSQDLLMADLSDPDVVCKIEGDSKGREILAWLRRHAGTDCRYAILDDMAEFPGELKNHSVRIDPENGISKEDAEKVIKMLS